METEAVNESAYDLEAIAKVIDGCEDLESFRCGLAAVKKNGKIGYIDKMGNVVYHRTARNFNQTFATAADFVIVEAEHIVEVGELDPDQIMTPHFIVDAVVQGKALTEA